jgi:hypothetical protein
VSTGFYPDGHFICSPFCPPTKQLENMCSVCPLQWAVQSVSTGLAAHKRFQSMGAASPFHKTFLNFSSLALPPASPLFHLNFMTTLNNTQLPLLNKPCIGIPPLALTF